MNEALSEWDKLRLEKAILAFRARFGPLSDSMQSSILNEALLAALRAADLVKPSHVVWPLAPAPERYDSLGQPVSVDQAPHPTAGAGGDAG